MKIEIGSWRKHDAKFGHVASFDASLDCGVSVRGLTLCRPEAQPDVVWLVIPQLERERRQTVGLRAQMRKMIGERAAIIYAAQTALALTYAPPPAPTDRVVVAEESEDAGLKRVIGETMKPAGLG